MTADDRRAWRWSLLALGIIGAQLSLLSTLHEYAVDLPPAAKPWIRPLFDAALLVALGAAVAGGRRFLNDLAPEPPSRSAWAGSAAAFAAAALGTALPSAPGVPLIRLGLVGWVGWAGLRLLGPPAALPSRMWPHRNRLLGGAAFGALGFAVAHLAVGAWDRLAPVTFGLVRQLLELFVPLAAVDTEALSLTVRDFSVRVAPACSGVESLGLLVLVFGAYALLNRDRLRPVPVLLIGLLTGGALFAGNAARIAALVLIGAAGHERLAIDTFHSRAGFLVFVPICVLGLWGLERFATAPDPRRRRDVAAARYLLPLLVFTGIGLATAGFFTGPDRAYVLRIAGAVTCLGLLRSLRGTPLRFHPAAGAVGGVGFALWWILAGRLTPADDAAWALAWSAMPVPERIAWGAVRTIGSTGVVPIIEELAFRGFLMRRLVDTRFEAVEYRAVGAVPWLLSSVAFGLVHSDVLAGTVTGLLYGGLVIRTGRLADGIVAHGVTNGLLAAAWAGGATWAMP